ncbi:MAG: hypothetical protein K2X04_08825 [Burkholderiales bacterium]|jgi:hypothetical protein|nr:hypothetical protein [Burkholderiales bacterium]
MGIVQSVESSMTFEYNSDCGYRIDDLPFYTKMSSEYSVKDCDFVWLKQNKELWFIEAKSSTPHPYTNSDKFASFIDEIVGKFNDSIMLYFAMQLNLSKTPQSLLPIKFQPFQEQEIRLILVINGFKIEWATSVRDKLNLVCKKFRYLANVQEIVVLNDDLARRRKLIL